MVNPAPSVFAASVLQKAGEAASGEGDALVPAVLCGFAVLLLVAVAEWLHARRVDRVAHLAFGDGGRPRAWTRIVPFGTAVAGAVVAFGLTALLLLQPQTTDRRPESEGSKHLLVCMDASPSMYVEDAGPKRDQKRTNWAGKLMHGVLERIDTETTRVTVFAVYTKAIPIVEDTFDLEVVEHLFDGIPFNAAFESGSTRLVAGIEEALEYARRWPKDSATLVIVSDGDVDGGAAARFRPASIADTIVIGVGDPSRPTLVAGHRSKQEAASLRSLAASLDGYYHQGNRNQLPSEVLDGLTMIRPRIGDGVGLREAAFWAIALGAAWLAAVGPALAAFGRSSSRIAAIRPAQDGASARHDRGTAA